MKRIRRVILRINNQKGIALLTMVFLLFLLSVMTIKPIVLHSAIGLAIFNEEMARSKAEQDAISATSPIRISIDEQIYNKMQTQLREHLRQAQLARQGRGTYVCQGVVNGEDGVSETWAICDPTHLLDGLKGAQGQSIDDLAEVKSLTPPDKQREPEWAEVEYELFNQFDYVLKPVFVGQQLISAGNPRRGSFGPTPRVERYRYRVKAEINMQTYGRIFFPLTVYYDVVISLSSFDESILCGGNSRINPGFSPPGRALAIAYCEADLTITAFDPGCKKVGFCTAGEDCYGKFCANGDTKQNADTCKIQAESECVPQDGMIVACQVSVNGKKGYYFGNTTKKTYISNGCASLGANSNGGFIWNTAIRIVSLGTNYD
ncbi:MAG: hypothetical protein AB1489_35915 [Acidobacteriota bacterium]